MTRHPSLYMAEELEKLVWSKETWIDDFSTGRNARPAHEVEIKKKELSVLRQAASDYRRAAERDREKQ